jgi:hypothetical protein
MNWYKEKISKVKSNPNNPRVIKDDKFEKLVRSIKEFPKMLEIRPIVVNDDMIVLGGNMRLKACKEAGLKEVPIIKASDLTEDEQRQFIIKDNVSGGEWDWEQLASEWDAEQLDEWGLDVPEFETENELSNNKDNSHLSQPEHLEDWLNSSIKQMKLTFEEDSFNKVVAWFEKKQLDFDVNNNSDVVLKLIKNEKD